jgi:glycosyltransferase involved in cell wall biosynthesis
MTPHVSILIPAYKPHFLRQAIDSALAQTFEDREVIVSDDCPDDAVAQVCAAYGGIAYVRNPDRGAAGNFDHCLAVARGRYVKFLLDDDLIDAACVQRMVERLEAPDGSGIRLVTSRRRIIDADGAVLGLRGGIPGMTADVVHPGLSVARTMFVNVRNFVGELTTVMFRAEDVERGFFAAARKRFGGLHDVSLILRLCTKGGIAFLHEPLSCFRKHADQTSNAANPNLINGVVAWGAIAADAFAGGMLDEALYAAALRRIAAHYRRFVPLYPQLAAESERLERMAAELSGGAT